MFKAQTHLHLFRDNAALGETSSSIRRPKTENITFFFKQAIGYNLVRTILSFKLHSKLVNVCKREWTAVVCLKSLKVSHFYWGSSVVCQLFNVLPFLPDECSYCWSGNEEVDHFLFSSLKHTQTALTPLSQVYIYSAFKIQIASEQLYSSKHY